MRAAISVITAATFWLHILLGCCAHHAHGAESDIRALAAVPIHEPHHGHSHGHDHSAPVSETPQHPGGSHDDCHENHCDFLLTGKTTAAVDALVSALPAVAQQTVVSQTAPSWNTWTQDTGDHLRLPVRLHLFNQVLLI